MVIIDLWTPTNACWFNNILPIAMLYAHTRLTHVLCNHRHYYTDRWIQNVGMDHAWMLYPGLYAAELQLAQN